MSLFRRKHGFSECTAERTATDNICTEVYQGVSERTEGNIYGENLRKWYEKQAENGVSERWQAEKQIVFAALAVVAALCAFLAVDVRGVAVSVILLSIFGIWADPLKLIRRKVSRASRWIVAVGLMPSLLVLAAPGIRVAAVATIIAMIFCFVAIRGNGHWRASETYKMSKHVLKALQPDDNTDHRDACLTAWQADGAREVVAAAAEMGSYDCEEIEWAVRKAAYTIGFSRASSITRIHEQERMQALRDARDAKAEAEDLRRRLERVKDYEARYLEYEEELRRAERLAADGARAISGKMDALEECKLLRARVETLEAANGELVKMSENPKLAAEIADAEGKRKLKEAYGMNLSIRKAAEFAGVSHRKAQEFYAQKKTVNSDTAE